MATTARRPGTKKTGSTGPAARMAKKTATKATTGAAEHEPGDPPAAARWESFRALAEASARGELVLLPRMLSGNDRRLHVRQTIREDHQERIAGNQTGTEEKFTKLHTSLFSFFRGTCLLFYRDMAGEDPWLPAVLALGDVHPENFGVMPSADNVPIFGSNDFDEACYAPFSWDLKRGATGFMIAAEEIGEHGGKRQRKIAEAFVRGYVEEMENCARNSVEASSQWRLDNAPEMVVELIEDARTDRSAWLEKKYHDEYRRGFRADDEHVPISGRRDEFQQIFDAFIADNDIAIPTRSASLRVKDVCLRLGQGTASLGLPRYYLMIEGINEDGSDDIIVEFKQARRSALAGLVPPADVKIGGHAERISHAQTVHLVDGDQFYGAVELDGLSFMVRERAPYREDIDLDDLSKKDWSAYAHICGRSLAQAHARSDETGLVDYDMEPAILSSMGPRELFIGDIVRFAQDAADRVRRDHEFFRADHDNGAFDFVDRIFR